MRILYLVQWFAAADEPGLGRAHEFARVWSDAGHDVRVVTGCVDHLTLSSLGRRPLPLCRRLRELDGIQVERVWSTAGGARSKWQRVRLFGSYALCAAAAAARGPAPDLVYASSPPTTVGVVGAAIARRFQVPLVYELRDLWPDMLLACRILEPGADARLVEVLERCCRRVASGLVTVTQGDAQRLAGAGIPRARIRVVPHGVDHWMQAPLAAAEPPPSGARLVCLYTGGHSPLHGLGDLLATAALLDRDDRFAFRLLGDGDDLGALRRRALELGLTNLHFGPALSRRAAFEAMLEADACVVCSAEAHAQHWLPNKVFEYLAAGKPVVASAAGELADLLRRAGSAFVVPPGQPVAMADALRRMAALSRAERGLLGRQGREFVLRHYNRPQQARSLLGWLEGLARRGGAS